MVLQQEFQEFHSNDEVRSDFRYNNSIKLFVENKDDKEELGSHLRYFFFGFSLITLTVLALFVLVFCQ
jgi:hypothetical protein